MFANKTSAEQVRVWVAGCATGEEAYSLAILLHEHAARFATLRKFKSSPATSTRTPSPRRANAATTKSLPPMYPLNGCASFSSRRGSTTRQKRIARVGFVRAAQPASRSAVFTHRSDHLPQSVDLFKPRHTGTYCANLPFRLATGWFSFFGDV